MTQIINSKLKDDIILKNFDDFKKRLITYVGENETENLINILGGEHKIMYAPFANTTDTGLAYDGSLIETLLNITTYAVKINQLLPSNKQTDLNSIVKVGLLHHIAKVEMYEPNQNSWEINNRGIIYSFTDIDGALRTGERSLWHACSAGIKFTAIEFEAMRIMDKNNDDNYSKYYSSTLSTVIKQANEIITLISKKK